MNKTTVNKLLILVMLITLLVGVVAVVLEVLGIFENVDSCVIILLSIHSIAGSRIVYNNWEVLTGDK